MESLKLVHDRRDRATFPPASQHRQERTFRWDRAAVWMSVYAIAGGTLYVVGRIFYVFYGFVTLHWLR